MRYTNLRLLYFTLSCEQYTVDMEQIDVQVCKTTRDENTARVWWPVQPRKWPELVTGA